MEYYERIKELREDRDISQEELSKLLNISQQTLSQYENNKRKLPIDLLKKYAIIFNVTTDYILGINENESKIKNQINIGRDNNGNITMK